MGLDVYLYRIIDADDVRRREAEYEKRSAAVWENAAPGKDYKGMTEGEKETARSATATLAAELGLGQYGVDETQKTRVEINSAKYPEHLFKIGYFRSSYNAGGIDSILSDPAGVTLSDIMGEEGQEYEFQPDWVASKTRAEKALADFRAYLEKCGRYKVLKTGMNPFGRRPDCPEATSEGDALRIFAEQRERMAGRKADPFGDWYSNGSGTFGATPLRVVAVMIGRGFADMPTAYVVYESDGFDWYEQALEIVAETCEWVLAQKDPQNYYLHWSG